MSERDAGIVVFHGHVWFLFLPCRFVVTGDLSRRQFQNLKGFLSETVSSNDVFRALTVLSSCVSIHRDPDWGAWLSDWVEACKFYKALLESCGRFDTEKFDRCLSVLLSCCSSRSSEDQSYGPFILTVLELRAHPEPLLRFGGLRTILRFP